MNKQATGLLTASALILLSPLTGCIDNNYRYLNLDTVFNNYKLAQEVSKEGQKLMLDYQNLERQKQNELQRLGSSIEQKRNSNGYLSQESFDADVNNFNKKQSEAANVLGARQNSISEKMAERHKVLQDSLDSFLRDYNAKHGYDAILLRESGVLFNPALDITQEVIAGLNARYKAPETAE